MESDEAPLEVVGDQQEVVAPLLGEPREVVDFQPPITMLARP